MNWLEVDQGNSRVKWRFRADDLVVTEGTAETPEHVAGLLAAKDLSPGSIALSSVRDPGEISKWQTLFHSSDLWVVQSKAEVPGLVIAYREPRHLGVDRWLAMLAAVRRFPRETLAIVDAGTALTFDVVNREGVHLGGMIAPGLQLMARAVDEGMARVSPDTEIPAAFLGKSTSECVRGGLWAALTGIIEVGLRSVRETGVDRLILTGGDAAGLADVLSLPVTLTLQDDLVLEGVYHARCLEFSQ